jgi:hypothetical protein
VRLDYDYEPDLDVDELDELDGVDMKRKAASVMNDVSETREAVDACRCMRTSAWKDNSKSYVDFFPKAAAANTKDLRLRLHRGIRTQMRGKSGHKDRESFMHNIQHHTPPGKHS